MELVKLDALSRLQLRVDEVEPADPKCGRVSIMILEAAFFMARKTDFAELFFLGLSRFDNGDSDGDDDCAWNFNRSCCC